MVPLPVAGLLAWRTAQRQTQTSHLGHSEEFCVKKPKCWGCQQAWWETWSLGWSRDRLWLALKTILRIWDLVQRTMDQSKGSIQRRGKWHGIEIWEMYDFENGLERKGIRNRENRQEVTVAPQVREKCIWPLPCTTLLVRKTSELWLRLAYSYLARVWSSLL